MGKLTTALCLLVFASMTMAAHHEEGEKGKAKAKGKGPAVYEMRTYTANKGKMGELHDRFRNHTIKLFRKHGMKSIAYWTPADDPNLLIYILRHKNQDSIEASWKAFGADPAWQKVYAESIANGRLVKSIDNVFMTKTDFSP
jgi:hypothetical protein